MHRVHIHCRRHAGFWRVQYLEVDLKTPVRNRIDRYADFERVDEILNRVHIEPEQKAKFDDKRWGIQACFIDLTEEQYTKLKCADAITDGATNRISPSHST
jgi:spore coat polysaccharide biosynthesis protein SpsF (cytidylyltransferase family)